MTIPFLDSVTSPEMRDRIAALAQERADVRATLYMLIGRHPEWLHSVGPGQDAVLRSMVPAIPPVDLRGIVADPDEPVFLWTGAVDVAYLLDLLESHAGPAMRSPRRLLDFGCGCGRLTRYLDGSERYQTIGSDVNHDHVNWCAANLRRVRTVRNETSPPLPLPDATLDLVYSLSVFSHLSEQGAIAWLRDLARVLVPGGLLAITTHGPTALQVIRGSKIHQEMFKFDEADVDDVLRSFHSHRVVFVPPTTDSLCAAKAGEDYGQTFIDPAQASSLWNDLFETTYYAPGGLRGWQDAWVLRRR